VDAAALRAWVRFVRGHAAVTGAVDAALAAHRLTLSDFHVLLHLARRPDATLRRSELADLVRLSPSGITRMLAGLEAAGLVERVPSRADGRVFLARLTAAGAARLRQAGPTARDGIMQRFAARYTPAELETLSTLLGRLVDDESGCP
jgi:DNA-binding MarR family transcriptional regulator